MEDAVPLEEIATDIDALMAGDAAERFEKPDSRTTPPA